MIPIKNEAEGKGTPFITISLICICIAAYFWQVHTAQASGLVPLKFVYAIFHPGMHVRAALFSLIVAFFLHGNLFHLVSNMWYLWLFGCSAERILGARSFVIIYVCCGILSMLIQIASSPLSDIPILGASGAIAGIMGLYLVMLPFAKILVYAPPIFLFRLPAFIFLLFWFFVQYLSVRWSLPKSNSGGVALWAHIGGYATGVIIALFLRMRGVSAKDAR